MTLLNANNIAKKFRQPDGQILSVIDGIDFSLQAGEVVCLLGASGSGKTTLLRILTGLETPDQGSVQSDVSRPGRDFGYLSQSDKLLPWRNILDNVMLGLELVGQDKNKAKTAAIEALRHVGMDSFASYYPAQLSGGMQQRILLARTLVMQPRLLLMDEPMSSLDVLARRELAGLIKNYTHNQNAAVLVVTHSVEEACFLADRVLLVTRSPAKLYKEIRISDTKGNGLYRGEAMDTVMQGLWAALGSASGAAA
jgi:NitT/TauT family transport system ATP-binding protein